MLTDLGNIAKEMHDPAKADAYYNESPALSREIDHREELPQEGLTIFRQIGNARGIMGCLSRLGSFELLKGDASKSKLYCQELIDFDTKVGKKALLAIALTRTAAAELTRGDFRPAEDILMESEAVLLAAEVAVPQDFFLYQGILWAKQGRTAEEVEALRKSLSIATDKKEYQIAIRTLRALATVLSASAESLLERSGK